MVNEEHEEWLRDRMAQKEAEKEGLKYVIGSPKKFLQHDEEEPRKTALAASTEEYDDADATINKEEDAEEE